VLYINNDAYFNLEKNVRLISKMKSLTELHVENDGLTSVPSNIKDLTRIEYLFLVGNKINELPPEINQMKHLRFLDVSDNPLPPLLNNDKLDPKLVIRLNRRN
jgi:Leucine-rich repeat (LRR) protein